MPKVPKKKISLRASIKKEEDQVDLSKMVPEHGPNTRSKKIVAKDKIKKEEDLEDIKPKEEERITIVIKQEGSSDEVKYISPVKGPDGNINIFDFDQLGFPPPRVLDAKYNQGFSRRVINKAFGGNYQNVALNWQGASKRPDGREPFLAFNTEYNPNLSTVPGNHSILLGATLRKYEDGSPVTEKLPLFARRGSNDWVMTGDYRVGRSGVLSAQDTHRLSEKCRKTWVKGIVKSVWGKEWVESENHRLAEEAALEGKEPDFIPLTKEGVQSAIATGLLAMSFAIVECVGYRVDWFEKLLEAEQLVASEEQRIKLEEEKMVKEEAKEEELVRGEYMKKEEDGDIKKPKKEGNAAQKHRRSKRRFKEEDAEGTRKSKRARRKTEGSGRTKEDSIEVYSESDDGALSDGVEEAIVA